MSFPSAVTRLAKLAQPLFSTTGAALLLAIAFILEPAAARAQVIFNGILSPVGSGFVEPTGAAVDAACDVFVTDLSRTTITELPAGGGAPIAIGSGFNFPQGIAIDSRGNLYVADTDNNAVKQIVADGGSYTIVNTLGGGGFFQPFSIAVDTAGNVFVADTSNAEIKEIPVSAPNTTTVLATGITSEGVALDSAANLYVAVRGTPSVIELTHASSYATSMTLGGGWAAPRGIAVDAAGNVYVTDRTAVKEITAASGLTTVVTLNKSFSGPFGLTFDRNDNLYIADLLGAKLAKLALGGIGFGAGNIGTATASIALPFQIGAGTTIGRINILTQGASRPDFSGVTGSTCTAGTYLGPATCTVNVQFKPVAAGARNGGVVLLDGNNNVLADLPVYGTGVGPQVTFQPGTESPINSGANRVVMAVDESGNVFAFSTINSESLVEIPAGGGAAIPLGVNFKLPLGIAIDGSGNLYVADANNNQVDEVIAASGYTAVKSLGSGFIFPNAVAVDGSGNVFVIDGTFTGTFTTTLKEIPALSNGATVLTLGGVPGNEELNDALAVDANGNLFVAYAFATTTNPPQNTQGYVEEVFRASGYQSSATLYSGLIAPRELAVDASENIYVADTGFNTVQELLASSGYTTALSLGSGFKQVQGVSLDAQGNVYAMDETHIERLDLANAPSLAFATPTPVNTLDAVDGALTEQVWNIGNEPLVFTTPSTGSNPSYAANFPENAGDTALCKAGLSLPAGTACVVSADFKPAAAGSISGSVVLTDNALNVASATQTISLSGTAPILTTTTALAASVKVAPAHQAVTFTATVTATGGLPAGTVKFFADGVLTTSASLSSGKASAALTLAPGAHSVTAEYIGESGYNASTSSAVSITVINAALSAYSGSGQTAAYGSLFAAPLTVALLSSTGQPLSGQTITFIPTGVSLSSTTAVTDGNGIASVNATARTVGSESVALVYQSATGATFTLTGTKASLNVTATSVSVPLGQPMPPLHYSVAGFANGDGPAVVTGAPAEATTAKQGSAAGSYPITIALGNLAATNYSFVFVPGTLTVVAPGTAASIVIESGNSQSALPGTLLPKPLTVLVKNSAGNPVEGISVSFAGSGLTVSPPSVLTNSSGIAAATAVATQTGTVTATATVTGTSLSDQFTETVP